MPKMEALVDAKEEELKEERPSYRPQIELLDLTTQNLKEILPRRGDPNLLRPRPAAISPPLSPKPQSQRRRAEEQKRGAFHLWARDLFLQRERLSGANFAPKDAQEKVERHGDGGRARSGVSADPQPLGEVRPEARGDSGGEARGFMGLGLRWRNGTWFGGRGRRKTGGGERIVRGFLFLIWWKKGFVSHDPSPHQPAHWPAGRRVLL